MHSPADFMVCQGLGLYPSLDKHICKYITKNVMNFVYIQSRECQDKNPIKKNLVLYSISLKNKQPFFIFERTPVAVPLNLEHKTN